MGQPDKGYAWVVLATSFVGYVIQGSVMFCQTLMYQVILHKFQMSAADTGAIGATFVTVLLMTSMFFISLLLSKDVLYI